MAETVSTGIRRLVAIILDQIKQLQNQHAHIAALSRQASSDALILTVTLLDLRDLTSPTFPQVIN
jgi:hypothetical protein